MTVVWGERKCNAPIALVMLDCFHSSDLKSSFPALSYINMQKEISCSLINGEMSPGKYSSVYRAARNGLKVPIPGDVKLAWKSQL